MGNAFFERITYLEYRLKAATTELVAFKSGQKYTAMEKKHLKEMRFLERENKKLRLELGEAHKETVTVRNQWFEIFEEFQKESEKKLAAMEKEKKQLEERALKAEGRLDSALDKMTEQRHRIYELGTALEEEKEKNLKLKAQINRDYENSSIPSSMSIKHKKISNSRKKQEENPVGSQDTPDTAEKDRKPAVRLLYWHRHRKYSMILILEKPEKPS